MQGFLGNHALWLALMVFFITRGLSLAFWYPRVMGDAHGETSAHPAESAEDPEDRLRFS